MPVLKILTRIWVPLVVVLVIAAAGYAVTRLHGAAFSSDEHPAYAETQGADAPGATARQLVYEVFGPPGTTADISYFDVDGTPQQVGGAALPWSLTLTSDSPSVIGSIVAQGTSESIGCRILVNGELKAEKISNQVNAFTNCLAMGA